MANEWKPDTEAGLNSMSLSNRFRQMVREGEAAKKAAKKSKATPKQLAQALSEPQRLGYKSNARNPERMSPANAQKYSGIGPKGKPA